jgi:hypothetical protein
VVTNQVLLIYESLVVWHMQRSQMQEGESSMIKARNASLSDMVREG